MVPGNYAVTARWSSGHIYSGSAKIQVLPTPQSDAAISHDLVQASGGLQGNLGIENAPIIGEAIAATASGSDTGQIQVRSGFNPPTPCTQGVKTPDAIKGPC